MNRREFLAAGSMALAAMPFLSLQAKGRSSKSYNVIVLGDTHYDAEPASKYHSLYMEKVDWLNKVQRAEFKRNGEMWRERCPRMVKRATRLIDKHTRMAFQMGDLVQGDCGSGVVHQWMLHDVMNYFKGELGGLPFVSVVGNHDIRGVDAHRVYHEYMPQRMSQELGQDITKTTFSFWIGPDVYIAIDFNDPDDAEIERLFAESTHARYTFVLVHGALFPMDGDSCRWIFHGSEKDTEKRQHFRSLFAKRNVICLCGHTHTTEFYDWYGDGGRITQVTVNSVWTSDKKEYKIDAEGADHYGDLYKREDKGDGKFKDESALFNEYKPGLRTWTHSRAAGSYRLNVSDTSVTLDFYVGDSELRTHRFVLR